MPKKRKSNKQQWGIVIGAAVVIASAAGSTLYFTGFFSSPSGGSDVVHQNTTFTDAYMECESYTRERYSSRLQRLTADNHSTRYDDSSNQYKIFFNLQMRKQFSSSEFEPYWVSCFVSAGNGKITEYKVGEAKESPVESVHGNRKNSFGWP